MRIGEQRHAIDMRKRSLSPWVRVTAKNVTAENAIAENTPVETSPAASNIIVDISTDADKAAKRSEDERKALENRYLNLFEEMEKAREQAKAVGESYKEKYRCLTIAMRIMAGDNVPVSDHRYLAEKDFGMYSQAIMMRRQKEKPKDYDSILEDEETSEAGGDEKAVSENGGTPENAGTPEASAETEASTDVAE